MTARILSLAAVLLVGCSSESGSGTPTQSRPAAFEKYCQGTLKVAKEYMTLSGPSAWVGNGATVPAGTSVLLSHDFNRWEAYAFLGDGAVVKIEGGFKTGLVVGTDFDSTCTDRANDAANERTVLLKRSTLYADTTFSGNACTLEAGQEFTNYSYSFAGGDSATLSSAEIKSTCGLDKAYSKDVAYAHLIAL